jgi:hypothetical protein
MTLFEHFGRYALSATLVKKLWRTMQQKVGPSPPKPAIPLIPLAPLQKKQALAIVQPPEFDI